MLYFNIHNYDEFKELFEMCATHDGTRKPFRNAVLLKYLRSRDVLRFCIEHNDFNPLEVSGMTSLLIACMKAFNRYSVYDSANCMCLNKMIWHSDEYVTDHCNGVPVDGSIGYIRYKRRDNGHVYKMKASKMYPQLIRNNPFGKILPEPVVHWLAEELTREWTALTMRAKCELFIDDNFEAIYSGYLCAPGFGSCMEGRNQHFFYKDAVKAKAAYLKNAEGKITARAVIYTDAKDQDGKIWRLCERQYSERGSDDLKAVLVNMLIEGGHIDGYKRVGADCHSPSAFIAVDGTHLSDRKFEIECNLNFNDTVSYQDSFKWYDINAHKAYNFPQHDAKIDLAITSNYLPDNRNYDEYHECYTNNDLVSVVGPNGYRLTCDEDELDDFQHVHGEWIHDDLIDSCELCGERIDIRDSDYYYTSEWVDGLFCCECCRDEAEQEFCENSDGEYVWFEGEVVPSCDIIHCDICEEDVHVRCAYYSAITDQYYCCNACRRKGELEFVANSDGEYSVCPECNDIVKTSELVETETGRMCKDCVEIRKRYEMCSFLNRVLR